MGLKDDWLKEVEDSLKELEFSSDSVPHPSLYLIRTGSGNLVLNLISLKTIADPADLIDLQADFQQKAIQMVNLWEDVWKTRKSQVLSRICSLSGNNQRIHGRKTTIGILTQKEADTFFNQYHLQGTAKAKYRFCLIVNEKVVAAASFSHARLMKAKGPQYRSAELIRFASKDGITVTGGLSKLIRHFTGIVRLNDLMSYADRDWSLGKGYASSGFKLDSTTPPSTLWLCSKSFTRYFPHRLPATLLSPLEGQKERLKVSRDNLEVQQEIVQKRLAQEDTVRAEYTVQMDALEAHDFIKIFNTGNLKYILYL